MSNYIVSESKNYILLIEIKRPKKRNAITKDMYGAMATAIDQGDKDPSIRIMRTAKSAETKEAFEAFYERRKTDFSKFQ